MRRHSLSYVGWVVSSCWDSGFFFKVCDCEGRDLASWVPAEKEDNCSPSFFSFSPFATQAVPGHWACHILLERLSFREY